MDTGGPGPDGDGTARPARGGPRPPATGSLVGTAPSGPSGAGRGTRPTSRDVARAAGVSQAAVSLVLGNKWRGRVAETTAERVRTAARDLGYRPNLAARTLRLGRTRTALLVVPALTSEFFAGVYAGAARVAAEHDFGVILYPSPIGTGPAPDPFASARTALDGVIASSMSARTLTAIRGDELPLVMLDSDPGGGPGATTVNLDMADGLRQVARHLLALGHRDFLHLAADIDSWTFHQRADGLADALGGSRAALRTIAAPLRVDAARDAATAALRLPGRRPTAVVCDDDVLAVGVLKAARALGLRVPGDLSVAGVDDLTLATAVEPELTTVRLPAEDVGAHGMRALLAVLDGHRPPSTTLPVELVVRASTAPPPGRSG
ncbi:substrate-binding domain-containing protein [Streptomyces sp. SID4919]|nr:LacI family DNA-binding transcriptional regulator [Streptomyces sp. SID4919]MYY12783.1 substrate-binding domain-containing protein [Streptomyces sp. SID4919]SCK61566.1 transcriptional regulator, LacI family [Streptomyces sp. AmelKG-E11A]